MRKIFLSIGAVSVFFLTGCSAASSPVPAEKKTDSPSSSTRKPAPAETQRKQSARVDYIEAEASVIREADIGGVRQQFGNALPQDMLSPGNTAILFSLSNHRDNLADYDYGNLASLNGVGAKEWKLLSSKMGGHHVSGVLVFPAAESPQTLTVSGLPVGDIVIKFPPTAG